MEEILKESETAPVTRTMLALDRVHSWTLIGLVVAQLALVGTVWGHTPLMAQLMAGFLGAALVGLCTFSLAERGVPPDFAAAIGAVGTLGYVLLAGRWTAWAPPFWFGVALLGLAFASGDRAWSRFRLGLILIAVATLAAIDGHRPLEVLAWTTFCALPYAALELWLVRVRRSDDFATYDLDGQMEPQGS